MKLTAPVPFDADEMTYPPIPSNATLFQRDYGYNEAAVLSWEWSYTFGKWSALVLFPDGFQCYTYPKP